jgi:hypothetical protein
MTGAPTFAARQGVLRTCHSQMLPGFRMQRSFCCVAGLLQAGLQAAGRASAGYPHESSKPQHRTLHRRGAASVAWMAQAATRSARVRYACAPRRRKCHATVPVRLLRPTAAQVADKVKANQGIKQTTSSTIQPCLGMLALSPSMSLSTCYSRLAPPKPPSGPCAPGINNAHVPCTHYQVRPAGLNCAACGRLVFLTIRLQHIAAQVALPST